MGLFDFKKKNKDAAQEQQTRNTNPDTMMMVRILAVGYLLWTVIQMIKTYTEGGEDAPSLGLLIASVAIFVVGAAWIAYISYKQWKRMKQEQRQAAEEAARLEEEAERLAEAEEEDYEDEFDDYEEVSDPESENEE